MANEKTKSVQVISSKIKRVSELLCEYYNVKGYRVESAHSGNSYFFVMTKDSLYRRLIGMVPVIAIKWEHQDSLVNMTVLAYMEHREDATKVISKVLQLPKMGFGKLVADALTDPMFGKSFCDEALTMSEGLLTSTKI